MEGAQGTLNGTETETGTETVTVKSSFGMSYVKERCQQSGRAFLCWPVVWVWIWLWGLVLPSALVCESAWWSRSLDKVRGGGDGEYLIRP
jgi:hypothetical protein